MSDVCPATDWNAIEVAPVYSQFAGVLAGFVFTGIVVLLSQHWSERLRLRTLRLFVAAFIVLGLDSYGFGLASGEIPQSETCYRVWTEMMIFSGLLGLGAVAVVSGIVWLIAAYLDGTGEEATPPHPTRFKSTLTQDDVLSLERLARTVLYGVSLVATSLLTVTALDYLNVTYGGRPPTWMSSVVYLYPPSILCAILLLRWLRHRARGKERADETQRHRRPRALALGTQSAVVYAVFGTLLNGVVINTPKADWHPLPHWVPGSITAVSLLMPAPTLIALVHAVPQLRGEGGRGRPGGADTRSGRDTLPGPTMRWIIALTLVGLRRRVRRAR